MCSSGARWQRAKTGVQPNFNRNRWKWISIGLCVRAGSRIRSGPSTYIACSLLSIGVIRFFISGPRSRRDPAAARPRTPSRARTRAHTRASRGRRVLWGLLGINRAFTRYPVNLIKAIANPSSLPGSNDLRDSDAAAGFDSSLLATGPTLLVIAARSIDASFDLRLDYQRAPNENCTRKKLAETNRELLLRWITSFGEGCSFWDRRSA